MTTQGPARRVNLTLPTDVELHRARDVFTDREIGSIVWPWAIGMVLVLLATVAFKFDAVAVGAVSGGAGWLLVLVAYRREARLWQRYYADAAALLAVTLNSQEPPS